uniref:HTTM-like domain-containing protein n=1 Tax=Oncorhynchus mykiss TaxID=8022 RepID=A0A8K9XJI9_ONCMY
MEARDTAPTAERVVESESRMKHLFGFEKEDLSSWHHLVYLLNRPTYPALLGIFHFLFGELSVIFTNNCMLSPLCVCLLMRASMFNFYVWVFFMGAVGIMLGCFYHFSCLMFISTYWYIFFLDKTAWNNHSYLYGLIGFQLTFMGYGLRNPKKNNAQISIVHFIAGIKKLDADWVGNISCHTWHTIGFFYPFRLIVCVFILCVFYWLSMEVVFVWICPFGIFFVSYFHCMNSQLFSIGENPLINCIYRFPEFLMPVMLGVIVHLEDPFATKLQLPD